MSNRFKTLSAVALLATTAAAFGLAAHSATPGTGASVGSFANVSMNQTAPEFTGIDKWLNSEPLTMQQLRGKVVLVDFWTYSCINCIHTLPYAENWYAKYKDQGLTVVGVHTPEYPFERDTDNVKKAIAQYGIRYPVAQDNSYATWNAWGNEYWPAFYLIDRHGHVVYSHFGEGDYQQTEAAIQRALADKS
jgi:thiol-disulfide isomerase/thioredoxin